MCDCYSMMCKCRKFYIPVHIADFAYPREIVKQAYCPYCNYLGPKHNKEKYETNDDGEFIIDNYLFYSSTSGGERCKTTIRIRSKRVNGFFALVLDKKHKDYKKADIFLEEGISFNGNPNNVANMVPDCYHYQCSHIGKKKERDKLFKCFTFVDYCRKYKRDIWKIRERLKYDCKFAKSTNSKFWTSRKRINKYKEI